MKKFILSASLFACFIAGTSAQSSDNTDYVRSSLFTIIINDEGLMDAHKAAIIKDNFLTSPIPEKFNDHNLSDKYRIFTPSRYSVTEEEIAKYSDGSGKKSGIGTLAQGAASEASAGLVDTTNMNAMPAKLVKFFDDYRVGNQLIAKWYNLSSQYHPETKSHFDMEMIKERGLYNASEFDKSFADKSIRGLSLLADAGENLIGSTFVVAVRFNYVNKADIAQQTKKTAKTVGKFGGKLGGLASAAVSAGADVAGKGYVVQATAFLFRLDWNEEISTTFYTDFYNSSNLNPFAESDIFSLSYVGSVGAWSDVQSSSFSKVSEDELVQRAAVRSLDATIAKLQKKYEDFRTKTPLVSTEPSITAFVGMKEGVEAGDKFEVLEKQIDENGIAKYKRVEVIKAEKGKVWDNRFAADEERTEMEANGGETTPTMNSTTFSGSSKKIYPGMLIRQIN